MSLLKTKEDLSDTPEAKWEYGENGDLGLCDTTIAEDRVMKILDKLWEDNAAVLMSWSQDSWLK